MIKFDGIPGMISSNNDDGDDNDFEQLEMAISDLYNCENSTSGYFVRLTNVTVAIELLSDDDDDNEYDPIMDYYLGSGLYFNREFTLPIKISGSINLLDFDVKGEKNSKFFIDEISDNEDDDDCPCRRPDKGQFLSNLTTALSSNVNFKEALDVIEFENINTECGESEKSDGNNDTTTVTISSGISINVVGDVQLATSENLDQLVQAFIYAYNQVNLWSGQYCDEEKGFRHILKGRAYVDPASIEKYDDDIDDDRDNDGEQRKLFKNDEQISNRRILQDGDDNGDDGSTSQPPISSSSPTTNPSLSTSPTNSKVPTSDPTSNPSPGPSPYPSPGPTLSSNPSLDPTVMPSNGPTTSPSVRVPDFFTILIQLEGNCTDCDDDTNFFDDTPEDDDGEGEGNNNRFLSSTVSGRELLGRTGGLENVIADNCYCGIESKKGGATTDDVLDALKVEWSLVIDFLDGETFVDESENILSLSEVKVFDCAPDLTEFEAYATADFLGFADNLQSDEVDFIESTFLSAYNAQADEICDPFLRRLISVRTIRVAITTDSPTMMPSISAMPSLMPLTSTNPSAEPSEVLSDTPSADPSDGPSMDPSTESSDGPSSNPTSKPSNFPSPTSTPTTNGTMTPTSIESMPESGNNNATNNTTNMTNLSDADRALTENVDVSVSSSSGRFLQEDQIDNNLTQAPSMLEVNNNKTISGNGTTTTTNDTVVVIGNNETSLPFPTQAPVPFGTFTPTDSPTTKSPDLFFLVFQLTGLCNGCESDTNIFDQISVARSRDLNGRNDAAKTLSGNKRRRTTTRASARLVQEETGKCSCDEDTEDRGVRAEDFFEAFSVEVEERGLDSVENVKATTQVEPPEETPPPTTSQIPSSSPTSSITPSSLPSSPLNSTLSPSTSSIPTNSPSQEASSVPSAVPSSMPSAVPSSIPSSGPSVAPSSMPSSGPSAAPSSTPSSGPSAAPSSTPSSGPSSVPSTVPSVSPSLAPSVFPSENPSEFPSEDPSAFPSGQPSRPPSARPLAIPSTVPSVAPSLTPSMFPSKKPSEFPSELPSKFPSENPWAFPSKNPSAFPSGQPSGSPSVQPSLSPSENPSVVPSETPSGYPSGNPSASPSENPSRYPSGQPSYSPSPQPSGSPLPQPSGSRHSITSSTRHLNFPVLPMYRPLRMVI